MLAIFQELHDISSVVSINIILIIIRVCENRWRENFKKF